MEVWGRSEKTPSFALVCGCFWRFFAVSIGWPTYQPQKILRNESLKNGWDDERTFLSAGKKLTSRSERPPRETTASGHNVCAGELCRYRRPIVDFRISQGQ